MSYRTIALVAAILALAGCTSINTTTNTSLTDQEKKDIATGKLVKPESVSTIGDAAFKLAAMDKIYVCAKDKGNSPCYQHLSERIAGYLSNGGVPTTNVESESTKTLVVFIGFGYSPIPDPAASGGNKIVMDSAEKSLITDNSLNHVALNTNENTEMLVGSALTKVGAGIAALALKSSTPYASYATLDSPNGNYLGKEASIQALAILAHLATSGGSQILGGQSQMLVFKYHGPAAPENVFPVLFDNAMQEITSKVTIN